jgi:hypothetical protein
MTSALPLDAYQDRARDACKWHDGRRTRKTDPLGVSLLCAGCGFPHVRRSRGNSNESRAHTA